MGGGGSDTTSTVYQSDLPEYARPYFENLMDRALSESQQPYQAYQGQRLAGMSDATAQGLGLASGFANSGLDSLLYGMDTSAMVGDIAMQYAGYNPASISNQTIGWQGSPQTGIDRVTSDVFDQNAADQYMSPYMQAVIDKAKQDAILNYGQEATLRGSQAATAGAFGGSRAAVQEQMSRNALQSNLTDLQVKGMQSAYENAQNQFNADRGRDLAAQQANQSAGLTMAQANQRADLEAQQLSEGFRQSGAQLGLQGLGLANDSAAQVAQMQGMWDSMMMDRIKTQLGVGSTQEDYLQQSLDQSYNDFVNQRDSERQNIQFLSSILRGIPMSANQDVMQTNGSNPLAGLLGSLGGMNALSQLAKQ